MVKPSQLLNKMIEKIKIGSKVKTELRAISCATGDIKPQIEWKHWWVVFDVDEDKITLKDKVGKKMFFDKSGRGLMPNTNHFIYKIK